MARVPYVDPESLPPEKRPLLDTLSEKDDDVPDRGHSLSGGTLNVYRAMGHDVDLLEAFRAYGTTLWQESGLTPHEREFVILTTAERAGSSYEWQQHVRVALDEGVSPAAVRSVSSGDHDDVLSAPHAALVTYVKRYVEGAVDDETHERASEHYEPSTLLGVGLLSGLYLGLARLIDAFGVELETGFVGWDLENL